MLSLKSRNLEKTPWIAGTKYRMVTHHKRLQHYKRHYGMVFLTGMFGCRWHRYQQSTDATAKRDLIWFGYFLLVSIFVLFYFYFWIVSANSEDLINWYAYKHIGTWYRWYTVMLVLTCVTVAYIVLLGVLALCHIGHGHQLYMHHVHKVVLGIVLITCVLVSIGIDAVWRPGWSLVFQSIMITGPFLHVALVAVMTFLSWFIAGQWMLLYKTGPRVVLIGLFMAIMVLLYVFPVFINSPCVVEHADLPSKPLMLAHKGASAIAPENTMLAFQLAAALEGVVALESDVTLSHDGVPFILHDTTLLRTTNVRELFPDEAHLEACRFNVSQLQQLDAGSWFHSRDPFRTSGQMSDSELQRSRNQSVILLRDLLDVAHEHKKNVMFDIKFECENHPHEHDFGDVIVRTIRNHSLPNKNMWWLAINRNLSGSEDFTMVWDEPEPVNFLLNNSVNRVNFNFDKFSPDSVNDMQSNNISVNLYVINAPWLYSLYWCMGVSSITTDQATLFDAMTDPVWRLDPRTFRIMWITTDSVSAVIIIIIFIVQRLRKIGKTFPGETISLQGAKVKMSHTKHNRNMKEKLLHTVESLQDLDVGISGIDSEPLPPTPQMARASLGCATTMGSINGDAVSIGTVSQGSVQNGGTSLHNAMTSSTSSHSPSNYSQGGSTGFAAVTLMVPCSNGAVVHEEHHSPGGDTFYSNSPGGVVQEVNVPQSPDPADSNRLSTLSGVSKLSDVSGLTEISDADSRRLSTRSGVSDEEKGDAGPADVRVDFYQGD